MIPQPQVKYTYQLEDAAVSWSCCDDSINVHDDGGTSICIEGVNATAMFIACRNALIEEGTVFHELKATKYTVESAKDMIAALQTYVDRNEGKL